MEFPNVGDLVEYKNDEGFHYLCFVLETYDDRSIDLVYWDVDERNWRQINNVRWVGNAVEHYHSFWRYQNGLKKNEK